MSTDITYDCVTCKQPHTAQRDKALALLKLCSGCAKTRYAAGKRAQKTTPPPAAKQLGDH